jgi:hypothetical protein
MWNTSASILGCARRDRLAVLMPRSTGRLVVEALDPELPRIVLRER